MAFNTNPGKQQFAASAGQTIFTFNFAIFADTDLKVYKTLAGATPDDTADILTLTTHYTVSINGTLGGTITLLSGAAINDTITIARSLPIGRSTDYVTNGDLLADTLDLDQDYQTYLTSDADVKIQRAIIVPESLGGVNLNIPSPVSDSYLRWNTAADALENDTTIPTAVTTSAANAAAALASETNAAASELLASKWASEAEDVVVSGGLYSAYHWAKKAAASAALLVLDLVPTLGSTKGVESNGVFNALATKQATLVSGTNIKSVNGQTLLGSGDLSVASNQLQPVTATVSANALTVTLNPTTLDFRSTTLNNGAVTAVTIAAPISLTVPDTATLGTVNGVKARLAVVAMNNAGAGELAIINTAGGNDLGETGLISTTILNTSSDANNVFYSNTARASLAYRVVGFIEITEATAGTWATDPTLVQGIGGQSVKHAMPVKSQVRLHTGNGFGSVNTCIRRFLTVIDNIGDDILYTDSATDGASFTIKTSGVYSIAYTVAMNITTSMGISLNSTQLTTGILSINTADILSYVVLASIGNPYVAQTTLYLKAGDVIRAHAGAASLADTSIKPIFIITRTF